MGIYSHSYSFWIEYFRIFNLVKEAAIKHFPKGFSDTNSNFSVLIVYLRGYLIAKSQEFAKISIHLYNPVGKIDKKTVWRRSGFC